MKNMKITYSIVLILAVALMAMSVCTVRAPGPGEGEYEITLAGVVYDPATDTQTWTYNIHCISGYAVSHINFEFDMICDPPLSAIVAAGPGSIRISTSYTDYIPGTTMVGVKIDVSVLPGETKQIWFTVRGEWATGTITAYVKADGPTFPLVQFEPEGPECTPPQEVPEVPLGPATAAASMLVAVGAYFGIRRRQIH